MIWGDVPAYEAVPRGRGVQNVAVPRRSGRL